MSHSNSKKKKISVICPVFNEENTISLYYERFQKAVSCLQDRYHVELIFINNYSEVFSHVGVIQRSAIHIVCEIRQLELNRSLDEIRESLHDITSYLRWNSPTCVASVVVVLLYEYWSIDLFPYIYLILHASIYTVD